MMKNIVIGILVVLCALLLVYALIQQTEAKRQQSLAEQNAVLAQAESVHAMQQAKIAEANAAEARRQQQRAEATLRDCMKGKK